jgi:4'-phosphopantetheinyl transferase
MTNVPLAGEVHVWVVPLDAVIVDDDSVLRCLSPGERTRARAIDDAVASRNFMLTRFALRHILAGYAGGAPGDIELVVLPGGKPAVASAIGPRFSVSHSSHMAVIAVALADVGIDVESDRRPRWPRRTAWRILHPETAALLDTLDADLRMSVFLDAWTQREAHIKAVGGGLFRTSDALPFHPGQRADGLLRQVRDRETGEVWSVARFLPDARTRAAVVVRGLAETLLLHDGATTLERMAEVQQ